MPVASLLVVRPHRWSRSTNSQDNIFVTKGVILVDQVLFERHSRCRCAKGSDYKSKELPRRDSEENLSFWTRTVVRKFTEQADAKYQQNQANLQYNSNSLDDYASTRPLLNKQKNHQTSNNAAS